MADKTDFNDFEPEVGTEAIKEKIEQAAQIEESDQEAKTPLEEAKTCISGIGPSDPGIWFESKTIEYLRLLQREQARL